MKFAMHIIDRWEKVLVYLLVALTEGKLKLYIFISLANERLKTITLVLRSALSSKRGGLNLNVNISCILKHMCLRSVKQRRFQLVADKTRSNTIKSKYLEMLIN